MHHHNTNGHGYQIRDILWPSLNRAPIGSDTRLGVITLFYGQGMPSHVNSRGLLTYNSMYEHILGNDPWRISAYSIAFWPN